MRRNYSIFFTICKAIGRDKEDVIFEFTEGRTSSLRDLSDGEFKELMIRLRKLQPTPKTWEPKAGDAQRKKMIGLARSMNWGNTTLDIIGRLDEWSLKTYKTKLNDMDVVTLGKALTVFENKVYAGYLKALKK